jgi:hypothetical protein
MTLSLSQAYDLLVENPNQCFLQTKRGYIYQAAGGAKPLHVYCGSFNPLHDGHRVIYDGIESPNKVYEISINRFDKEPLGCDDLRRRLRQFVGYAPVLITNVMKFVEKAGILRMDTKVTFHVGGDTILRILQHTSPMEVQGYNCNFVYYKRIEHGQVLEEPTVIPRNCSRGFEIPNALMRISSTQLREAGITVI